MFGKLSELYGLNEMDKQQTERSGELDSEGLVSLK